MGEIISLPKPRPRTVTPRRPWDIRNSNSNPYTNPRSIVVALPTVDLDSVKEIVGYLRSRNDQSVLDEFNRVNSPDVPGRGKNSKVS